MNQSNRRAWTSRRSLVRALFLLVLGCAATGPSLRVQGAEPPSREAISGWLSEEILPAGLVNDEFQQWCEPRIVTLAKFDGAEEWSSYVERIRTETLERVVFRGTPAEWRKGPPAVVWGETLETGGGYRLRKLRYEALPGLWIPALLYVPDKLDAKAAVALHVNGHDPDGKAATYKQIRSINLAKRGMLVLNVEWLGMGQLRGPGYGHGRMNQLELAGVSGLAPFYLAMQRGLDVLLAQEHADHERVAVSGLSGGGWQTIYLAALDPRVTLANPVAGYSSFRTRLAHHTDLGDSEQTPTDMATIVDYTHLTAMRAPRPTLLTYNAKDNCCFAAAHALPPLLAAAEPIYKIYRAESKLRSHVNHDPGTHNFERENREAYYAILADSFAPRGAAWPREEIECPSEVKTPAELNVELPVPNADFHSLALQLAKSLPRDAELPADLERLTAWRDQRRLALARLLRTPPLGVQAQTITKRDVSGWEITRRKLRIGESWTVPVLEVSPAQPVGVAVVVADEGRKSARDLVEEQLKLGRRVIAVDPFYLGESAFPQRAYLFALLTATVGDRTLGLQARQIQAVAKWAAQGADFATGESARVTVIARGPRASLATLAASVLADESIGRVELHQALGSLQQVLEQNWSYEQAPGCFTFGLLEHFDVKSLVEASAPREIKFLGADERTRQELGPVAEWYRKLGKEFSPIED